jgi:hypothetical protein
MVGDGSCQSLGEDGMAGMEGQEPHDRTEEILDVLGLDPVSATGPGLLAPGVLLRGSFRCEFGTDTIDCCCRGPDAPGEELSPSFLLNDPVVAGGLDPTSQGGIARRKEGPVIRCGQDLSIAGPDAVQRRARSEGMI